ncbi:HAUS augmin-like complex subunit 3 [Lineus longissimus]|uniref:HAUS augmin-like complex subunit 3 n=1 Tax=Lineus longissimus TaxID=88925 RepID=UPI00315CA6A3
MNGSHFLESVTDIGYTWTKGLTSQSFDWMFEKEEILPFLEWVCNSLGSSNMLSNGELKQFDDLGKRGHILIGQQLDEALKSIESSDGEYLPSDEDIRKDSESLEHEIMRSKKWKEQLIKQRNQLSVHNTSLGHRQAQIGKLEAKAKQYLVYHLQRNQSDNDTVSILLVLICHKPL